MTLVRCLKRSHPLLVLFAAATVYVAELKVDLRNERVGRPPTTFEPMTATGSVLRPPLFRCRHPQTGRRLQCR